MSAAVAAAMRELPGYQAGREAERTEVVALIQGRGISALKLAKHGRITEEDAQRLNRWLGALAGDIEAGLHEPEQG